MLLPVTPVLVALTLPLCSTGSYLPLLLAIQTIEHRPVWTFDYVDVRREGQRGGEEGVRGLTSRGGGGWGVGEGRGKMRQEADGVVCSRLCSEPPFPTYRRPRRTGWAGWCKQPWSFPSCWCVVDGTRNLA